MACDAEYKDAKIVLFGAALRWYRQLPPRRALWSFGESAVNPMGSKHIPLIWSGIWKSFLFATLAIWNYPLVSCRKALDIIGEFVFQTVNDGKFPLMTGGEHLVSLGAVEALSQTYPDLHILHFDAHADLREDYLGDTLSHAVCFTALSRDPG